MSILGKYIDNVEDTELYDNKEYTLPAVLREDRESMTMQQAFFWSVVLHFALVLLTWLICLLMLFFGISFKMANKPNPKLKDIEFVLVENEAPPINKKTPYRADINSRAGGHHDPTKKVSMPSPAPSPAPKKAATPAATPQPKPQPKQQPKQKTEPAKKPSIMDKIAKQVQPPKQESPAPKSNTVARPNPPTARPSAKPPMTPKTVQKPTTPFNVPVPKGGTTTGHYATGPVSGSGKSPNGGSSTGSYGSGSGANHGKLAAAPSLSPTGRGAGSGSGSKMGTGSGGSGYGGNPGPGNPNGRPGIDALREPDFGPYMRDLQRRIKMNWNPPKGNESKRVVLMFKIAKDGRLLSCSVFKSSGLPSADKAALDAVKLTAPFKPLPAEYKNSSIDIQFTFDYNVFGAGY